MKKSILLLLNLTLAHSVKYPYGQNLTFSPQVGAVLHPTLKNQNTTVADVEPHCHLSALETCTTQKTAKLCTVKIHFDNCESISVEGDKCDRGKEGKTCQKKKLKGKVDLMRGFYNEKDKKARGFQIRMEDGYTYSLGYTPSKLKKMIAKQKVLNADP